MHSVHFSAFRMHYPHCKTLPVRTRNCRLLQRHFRDVTLTPVRITDITLSRMTCAGSHSLPRIRYPLPDEEGQKGRKGQIFSDHAYSTVSSRPRGRCVQSLVQIGLEMWICIRLKQTNKQTNKQTFSFIYKIS